MKFIFFRHGETDSNVAGIVQGAGVDTPLNVKGIQQAQHLAEKTPSLGLEKIYSSYLCRAIQTATISAAACQLAVFPLDGLEEFHYGDVEGMALPEVINKYGADSIYLGADIANPDYFDFMLPNGESVHQCQNRVCSALDKIKAENPEAKCIGIFTHGAVMFYLYYLYFNEFKSFVNCEFFEVEM